MKYPKISIVTPSYNQGRFVEEAIVSVLNQGYPDFEHIVVDGLSTDNTAEIVAKYPHVVFISEKDEGQSDAINKGFQRATGDVIGWLNTDDYYLPGTFHKVGRLLSDPQVDGCYANVKFIDGEGQFTRNLVAHSVLKWLAFFHCYIPSTTFFFKRKIVDQGLLIDKDMHISMDKEFFVNILYSGFNIRYVNDFFAAFRWHDSNKSIDSPDIKRMRFRESLIIINRYTGLNLPLNDWSLTAYKYVEIATQVFRKLMKAFNYRYKLNY